MASVYIETTIPSAYFETRQDEYCQSIRVLTRRWWRDFASSYRCVSSDLVSFELSLPGYPEDKRRETMAWIGTLDLIETTPEVIEIAHAYMKEKLMPKGAENDAVHLALAGYWHLSYLLTWNCRHLANPGKRWWIEAFNHKLGIGVPMLVTPADLMVLDSGRSSHGPR